MLFAPTLESEVRDVLHHIRTSTSPSNVRITAEALRVGADTLVAPLTHLFNEYIRQTRVPIGMTDAKTILTIQERRYV